MSGGYIKPCGCDEDEKCRQCDPRIGYSIYCDKCRQPTMAKFKVGQVCALCEIERLRAELQKTLDAGATWERAYWETKQKMLAVAADLDEAWKERDEARQAARYLWREGIDECWMDNPKCGGETLQRWPWLEDSNTNDE